MNGFFHHEDTKSTKGHKEEEEMRGRIGSAGRGEPSCSPESSAWFGGKRFEQG